MIREVAGGVVVDVIVVMPPGIASVPTSKLVVPVISPANVLVPAPVSFNSPKLVTVCNSVSPEAFMVTNCLFSPTRLERNLMILPANDFAAPCSSTLP